MPDRIVGIAAAEAINVCRRNRGRAENRDCICGALAAIRGGDRSTANANGVELGISPINDGYFRRIARTEHHSRMAGEIYRTRDVSECRTDGWMLVAAKDHSRIAQSYRDRLNSARINGRIIRARLVAHLGLDHVKSA